MVEFKITGMENVMQNLHAVARRAPRRAAAALFQEGELVMAQAKRRTPVDTGVLQSSGRVAAPRVGGAGSDVSVELSFGGAAAPYAVTVHEDLSAKHPTGQAKFLEQPLLESTVGMAARLARRITLG